MKRRSFLFLVLLVSMLLTLTVVANAETTVTTYEDMYVGEYVSETHEGFAHIVFGQVSDSSDEYGIIVEDQNGVKKLFKGRHIGDEGKFGIALYGVPSGSYTVCAYTGKGSSRKLGNKLSFMVEIDWESIFEYSDGVITGLTEYGKTLTEIEIPSSIGDQEIIGIGPNAFNNHTSLERIEIPDSVESIGYCAFASCASLKSVIMGNNVENIGIGAFSFCSALESIEIPNSVKSIGADAFAYCRALKSVVIHDGVISIGESAFFDCKALIDIEVPNSVESIGYRAFSNCTLLEYNVKEGLKYLGNEENPYLYLVGVENTSITTINIDANCRFIGDRAFLNCDSLTSIEIPDGVISIDWNAFNNCTSLESIEIPNSVESIGYRAFSNCTLLEYNVKDGLRYLGNAENPYLYLAGVLDSSITTANIDTNCKVIGYNAFNNCTSLERVEIPNSVQSVGSYAFAYCRVLESIEIPNSVKSIEQFAFTYCRDLKSAVIGNSVESIGYCAFWDCPSLESVSIGSGVEFIDAEVFRDCTALKSIEIPDSVTIIGGGAFYDCISLEYIIIPDSVTTIVDWAFHGCISLENIDVDEDNQYYSSIDGNLYDKSAKTLVLYAIGKTAMEFIIPDSVKSIGPIAFNGCTSLESVIIGNSVKSIGASAFEGLTSLKSIEIPDSITIIGNWAFSDCTSLKSVTIGNNIECIGEYAFRACTSLTYIVIPNSVTSIGYYAFAGCTNLIIGCEAESKPSGWSDDWNYSDCPVIWGIGDEDYYLVTFSGNGGNLISGNNTQLIVSGDSAIAPTYEREGYTFVGWDVDFSCITSDLAVTAQWSPNSDTEYIVDYYKEYEMIHVSFAEGTTGGFFGTTERQTLADGEALTMQFSISHADIPKTNWNLYFVPTASDIVNKSTDWVYSGFTNVFGNEGYPEEQNYVNVADGSNWGSSATISGTLRPSEILEHGKIRVVYTYKTGNQSSLIVYRNLSDGSDYYEEVFALENIDDSKMLVNNFNFVFGVNGNSNNINPGDKNFDLLISDYVIYKSKVKDNEISFIDGSTYCLNGMNFDQISEYSYSEREVLAGTTDTTANAEIKEFAGYIFNETMSVTSGNIAGDGSLVLRVYYDVLDEYTVTFNGNGGTLISGEEVQKIPYGGSATVPTYERDGNTFDGFDVEFSATDKSFTVTAKWVSVFDYSIMTDGVWIWGLSDYGKTFTEIIIPSTIDGVEVTRIVNSAFYNCTSISSVTIPDSVTSIVNSAFYNCTSLKNVYYQGDLEGWLNIEFT
ncbi:MAG: leucine-rich repeat protein, partial [Clostridia bacterium]|nr:leucine-rich repeat protein [Clostridia bacterium]